MYTLEQQTKEKFLQLTEIEEGEAVVLTVSQKEVKQVIAA